MSVFWTFGDLIFVLLLYIPVSWTTLTFMAGRPGGMLAGQLIGYVLWFLVIAVLFRLKYRKPFWRSLGWKRKGVRWWLIPAGVTLVFVIGWAAHALGITDATSPVKKLLDDPALLPLAAIAIVIAGPLAEELFFRGFAQPLLVRESGPLAGILLTAAAFGLLHLPQARGVWQQAVLVAVAGAVFGFVRHVTDSTLASTVMHASYNGTLLSAYLWERIHG